MKALALAIGVSDAPRLPYLGGAVNGARDFHAWAAALGYKSKLVTDEAAPVTIRRLKQELEDLLEGGPYDRLLIYYAGHGLIRELEEGLWLLSDWHVDLRAVAVEVLKRRLYQYGVKQIGIFADACRSLPNDVQAADLTADGVLGRGPFPVSSPDVDKFIATQDGATTFMIPGDDPDEDRCLFSGVLLEGLWGARDTAFSTLPTFTDKVTSGSLAKYLKAEVPKLAVQYGVTVQPTAFPAFAEGDNVYFIQGQGLSAPKFPDWPAKLPPLTARPQGLRRVPFDDEGALTDRVGTRRRSDAPSLKPNILPLDLVLRNQSRPDAFETESGFAVAGDTVRAVWTRDNILAEQHGEKNWWRIGQRDGYILRTPAPVLIEFASGLFAATTALPRFIASLVSDESGVKATIYREIRSNPAKSNLAEITLARLETGHLRAEEGANLAVELRMGKHADPVLGAVSAYLYDSMGDLDSIRSMAYYYVAHGQPIPYDIALLGQLNVTNEKDLFYAQVPAVDRRKPRTDLEKAYDWTYSPTPPAYGVVGGSWPWLRQGWAFLYDPADFGSKLLTPGLPALTRHLTTARFATFDADGARELAQMFGLSPHR